MKVQSRFSWLRDLRVVVLAIGCMVTGFLAATLTFGAPWHLPPAWGDIPTWLAFIAASVAGSAALIQLSQQQRQITEEAARNIQRDELVRTQLAEATERMNAIRRQQAEQVIMTAFPISSVRDGDGRIGMCQVTNESGRPIRGIACRMLIAGKLIMPREFESGQELNPVFGTPGPGGGLSYLPADEGTFDLVTGGYFRLLANQVIRVIFPADSDDTNMVQYLVRFTDDAEVRWQLDNDMHLSSPPDNLW